MDYLQASKDKICDKIQGCKDITEIGMICSLTLISVAKTDCISLMYPMCKDEVMRIAKTYVESCYDGIVAKGDDDE